MAEKTDNVVVTSKGTSPSLSSPSSLEAGKFEANHVENHSSQPRLLSDIIIGFSDGLTVPFALTAGMSSLGSARLVLMAGLAELFAGGISMGLGAYLGNKSEIEFYKRERYREEMEVDLYPEREKEEIYEIFAEYEVDREAARAVVESLSLRKQLWVDFMMKFELELMKPNDNRVWVSALTIGFSYMISGIFPMIPYFVMTNATHALFVSIAITAVILITFGVFKSYMVATSRKQIVIGAIETLIVGASAAGVSYGLVLGIDHATRV
ncbi:Ccc1 family [Lipomyces tetrasporus]|uniref:Ccc1 family n=1 Tax=Lipomyces tetrasporus TaxID=54092 RepID=A0AAD7VNS9_9ASCO|nr:Ccc1 family [Lipomyces tetrasporus]KAJ8096637.1 Ccc1 family [Lipomyces tetrasporus]